MGRGKDKRTIEKKQQFIEQMNHFMIHDQLKFVNLKGHKTNLMNIRYETIKTWNVRYNKKRSTTRES